MMTTTTAAIKMAIMMMMMMTATGPPGIPQYHSRSNPTPAAQFSSRPKLPNCPFHIEAPNSELQTSKLPAVRKLRGDRFMSNVLTGAWSRATDVPDHWNRLKSVRFGRDRWWAEGGYKSMRWLCCLADSASIIVQEDSLQWKAWEFGGSRGFVILWFDVKRVHLYECILAASSVIYLNLSTF